MGLFNAVRRYLLPAKDAATRSDATETSVSGGSVEKPDGIVVVGDGNTRACCFLGFSITP